MRPRPRVLFPVLSALLGAAVIAVMGGNARADTVVTGAANPVGPLVIEPDTGARVDTGQMLFFIQEMPTTKTVNRITLGDLAMTPGCKIASPTYNLTVRQHPSGAMGTSTSTGNWEANPLESLVFDADLEQRTWRMTPVTFRKGYGYSFWVKGNYTACQTPEVRSWTHNEPKVNAGANRCDLVIASRWRMWHEAGQSDAVACGYPDTVPVNFDPSMPPGWLSVYSGSSPNNYVDVRSKHVSDPVPTCSGSDYGAKAIEWRPKPDSPTYWKEYVCVWGASSQFPDYLDPSNPFYPQNPDDGWYYGFGYYSIKPGGPRDLYVKLELDEAELAASFKPSLLFDSSEKWRPLNLETFFAEHDALSSAPLHRRCQPLPAPPGTPVSDISYDGATPIAYCPAIESLDDLTDYSGADAYLDSHGYGVSDESDYRSPDSACNVNGIWDCNGGTQSALYYYVSEPLTEFDYRYIGYWAFYRFNHFSDGLDMFEHEGDWEGLAVAPSYVRPDTFDFVSFSAHEHWWSYLRDTLECDDDLFSPADCGTESAPAHSHVMSYVANGSHANYPSKCSETVPLVTCSQPDESTPERGHDGAKAWGHNAPYHAPDPNGLIAVPELEDGQWIDWPGKWGPVTVDSPAYQDTFLSPWDQCGEDDEQCPPFAASVRRKDRPAPRPAVTSCGNWFGPSVAVVACDAPELRRAARRKTLGRAGKARAALRPPAAAATRRERYRIGTAPGLVQVVGQPLVDGTRLRLVGRASQANTVQVRFAPARGQLHEATFQDVQLTHARPATVRVDRGRVSLISGGRTYAPSTVRKLKKSRSVPKHP